MVLFGNESHGRTFAQPFMKKLTAILLSICIISSGFSRFFIYAGFDLNQKYIAAKLCENRNKPWMHCNGRCYLAKKLKQAADKQAANERETQKNLIQETYCEAKGKIKFFTHLIGEMAIPNGHSELPQGHATIFRPPQIG